MIADNVSCYCLEAKESTIARFHPQNKLQPHICMQISSEPCRCIVQLLSRTKVKFPLPASTMEKLFCPLDIGREL